MNNSNKQTSIKENAMLERTRTKVRKAVSLALAAVMCAGMVPATAADVSAANYAVHTVKDLIATAHE